MLFITIVILGVFVMIFLSNQSFNSKKKAEVPFPSIILPSSAPVTTGTLSAETSTSSSPSVSQTIPEAKSAVIKTSKGDIEISFYAEDAPKTVENFVKKGGSGFYNNLTFHRVEDWVAQGGDPKGDGTGGGNMPVEFNNKPFVVGALGIASRGDGKVQNDSQFFITKKDSQFLNNQYTNFGIVTKGMDVVNKIQIGDKILGITLQ